MTGQQSAVERAARLEAGPLGPAQASYLSICGKELATRDRSGESPSLPEGVLQRKATDGLFYCCQK